MSHEPQTPRGESVDAWGVDLGMPGVEEQTGQEHVHAAPCPSKHVGDALRAEGASLDHKPSSPGVNPDPHIRVCVAEPGLGPLPRGEHMLCLSPPLPSLVHPVPVPTLPAASSTNRNGGGSFFNRPVTRDGLSHTLGGGRRTAQVSRWRRKLCRFWPCRVSCSWHRAYIEGT